MSYVKKRVVLQVRGFLEHTFIEKRVVCVGSALKSVEGIPSAFPASFLSPPPDCAEQKFQPFVPVATETHALGLPMKKNEPICPFLDHQRPLRLLLSWLSLLSFPLCNQIRPSSSSSVPSSPHPQPTLLSPISILCCCSRSLTWQWLKQQVSAHIHEGGTV